MSLCLVRFERGRAHLADLKKSEALRTSQAPEIRKYLEQLNSAQGDILNRLRTLPDSPAGGDTWGKRLAWQAGPTGSAFPFSPALRRAFSVRIRLHGRLEVGHSAGAGFAL